MSDLGWTESPTQYSKIKGKDIEEKDFECSCEGSWGPGDPQDVFFHKRTIYPFNKVYQSESGHIIEIDDNKESERISINHRTGTFVEFHPNGDRMDKIVRDSYTSILRDNRVHVSGYSEITVDKSLKILVNSGTTNDDNKNNNNLDIHVAKGANINIYIEKGDVNVTVEEGNTNTLIKKGNVNLRQEKGDYRHYVNGNYRLHVTGKHETIVENNQLLHIKGSRATAIDGILDYLELTNSNSHIETRANKESKILFSDMYLSAENFVSRTRDQTILETCSEGWFDEDEEVDYSEKIAKKLGYISPVTGKALIPQTVGEFTINSGGNIYIASGWDSIKKTRSSNKKPRLNLFAYKKSRKSNGGDITVFTDNDYNLFTSNQTKFQIMGGTFHIRTNVIRSDAISRKRPTTAQRINFPAIYFQNYSKINYDNIMLNGFQQITIR